VLWHCYKKIVPELSISGKKETSAALIKLSSTTTGSSTTGSEVGSLLEHENKIAKKVAETSKLNFFHFLKRLKFINTFVVIDFLSLKLS
jgi:hypothetical protein